MSAFLYRFVSSIVGLTVCLCAAPIAADEPPPPFPPHYEESTDEAPYEEPLVAQEPAAADAVPATDVPPSPAAPAEVADVQAGELPAAVPNLNGFWSGSWSSYQTGHTGPMSATFCQIDACHYEVRFRGRFWKLIPFHYTVVLTVTGHQEGRVLMSGSHHLPVFGQFSYNAWATETQFVAGYCARKDQGVFSLSRCCR